MFSIIQLYIKKANFTLNIIFEYLEIFALFVLQLIFTFIILLNNVSRETFFILQINIYFIVIWLFGRRMRVGAWISTPTPEC